jgi:pyrophosphatase PpaX
VGADDVTRAKPDAEPVLAAMAALGADPATTVFVGDSPHDMAAGRAAGVRTAAVLWGPFRRDHLAPHAPDHWLDDPEALTRMTPAWTTSS